MLRPYLENSLRPLYKGLSNIQYPGNSEEGLNRRGARDLDDSDATVTLTLTHIHMGEAVGETQANQTRTLTIALEESSIGFLLT